MIIRTFYSNLFVQLYEFAREIELMAADATGHMIGGRHAGGRSYASGRSLVGISAVFVQKFSFWSVYRMEVS